MVEIKQKILIYLVDVSIKYALKGSVTCLIELWQQYNLTGLQEKDQKAK